jgi:hypothetical protein
MSARNYWAMFAALLLTLSLATGRPVNPPHPEWLVQRADLVCSGVVLSVTDLHIKIDSEYANVYPPLSHEMWMRARIKLLHLFKGTAPATFDVDYRTELPDYIAPDGPNHVSLEKGRRYRFFLKPDKTAGAYLDVLDGEIDDEYAVESLGPDEPDDGPWLTETQAIQIGRAYIAKTDPRLLPKLGHASAGCEQTLRPGGAWWMVTFWPTSHNNDLVQVLVAGGKAVTMHQGNGMWSLEGF